jgi:hypothetical protein
MLHGQRNVGGVWFLQPPKGDHNVSQECSPQSVCVYSPAFANMILSDQVGKVSKRVAFCKPCKCRGAARAGRFRGRRRRPVFYAWTYEGAFVHKDGFQIAHEERVNVQLLAQAVHGNEVEIEIEFGEVEDFHGQAASRQVSGSQSVGFLPETLLGIVGRFLLPLKSRDELPPILAGLKWIFLTPEINAQVFTLLEEKLVAGKKAAGRPGLDLWQILVLGVVRLGLDCDYDRLEHLANYDSLLRQILGLSPVRSAEEKPFHYKTLSENICHLDDELLQQINAIVAQAGRAVFKKKKAVRLNPSSPRRTAPCWKPTSISRPT